MASGSGRSLGSAVHDLIGAVPSRSFKQQLTYVTGKRTGASRESVIRQLGISDRTMRRWRAGGTPSKASAGKLNRLFERFWKINHPSGPMRGNERLKITASGGAIQVDGRDRNHLWVEPSRTPRDWAVLAAASVRQINAAAGDLFIGAAAVEIPYVDFGPGTYLIETY